jgi:adenylate kinase family enzyme
MALAAIAHAGCVQRVVVVGSSGSGKTTLARRLSVSLGLEHVELDALFHGPGWAATERKVFRTQVAERLDGAVGGWITCGNYTGALDGVLWPRADTIVWLDLPRMITTWRVTRRTLGRVVRRTELWNGNRERLTNVIRWDPERNVIRWSWAMHNQYHQQYESAMRDPRWDELDFVRLCSPLAVDWWIDSVTQTV